MTKNELMTAIETSWSGYWDQVGSYDRALVELEAHDGWSVKDHVAHIAAWEQNLIALLTGRSRFAAMGVREFPPGTDFDQINAEIRLLHHHRSYPEVVAFATATHDEVMKVLDGYTLDDLEKPYRHYQPQDGGSARAGDPVYGWVNGMTHFHYAEHRPWIASLYQEVTSTPPPNPAERNSGPTR